MRNVLLTLAALYLTGCTLGPERPSPEIEQPPVFRFATDEAIGSTDIRWWALFEDAALEALVEEALRNNLDVRIATARVEEFWARIGVTRSAAFPQIGYAGGASRNQASRETPPGNAGGERVTDFFEANLSASWEIDVFGRIRRATDAARADALAETETRRAVVLSLVSSVATSYVALLSLDEQLAVSRQKLDTRQKTVDLFELQFSKGVISQLELAQIRSEYERTAAAIPAIQRDIALLENSLSTLLGRPPGAIERGSTIETLALPPVPAGLPSDVLLQRPDVRAAEQQMIAANERVGVAVAEFYPSFSLTGLLGFASDDLSNLFTSSAGVSNIAGGVLGPLFTAGFLENQLEAAEAGERGAIESYRSAVLTALRESEDALVTRSTTIDEAAAQSRQVDALALYADLAQRRYDNGFVGYLEVLDAERNLFDAQLSRIRLRGSLYASVIGMYKAFGGGWVSLAEEQTAVHAEDANDPGSPGGT